MLGTVFSALRTSPRGEHYYDEHFIDEKRNSGLEESGDWPSYAMESGGARTEVQAVRRRPGSGPLCCLPAVLSHPTDLPLLRGETKAAIMNSMSVTKQ